MGHRYIPGSFKDISNVILKDSRYEVSSRVEDSVIQTLYPGKEKYMEGLAGTILLEDTRGFHAGTPLQQGYRQLVQWEFAISNYRYAKDAWFVQSICASQFNQDQLKSIKKYSRMF